MLLWKRAQATTMPQITPLRGNLGSTWIQGILMKPWRESPITHACSVDKITAKLKGITVFTIMDFKKGYWMVVLHPDSRKLTCMVLPFGRFQWTRLPMGTVVAQDIFQSKLDAIYIGMEDVTGTTDDMAIAGRDEMEHDRNFLAFMEKCLSNNLTLNAMKIQLKQSQVSFYGN